MPDICDLILDDHETMRRRFAELDEQRQRDSGAVQRVWEHLGELLDLHASAEETVFYPALLARGDRAKEETLDAIKDHNLIRDAVEAASAAAPDSAEWWQAVGEAREQNSDHMGEEERGALADFRTHADQELREQLGAEFVSYKAEHAGGRLHPSDKDPEGYVAAEQP